MLNFFIKFKQLIRYSLPTFFVLFFTFFNILVSKNFFDFGVFIALHGIFFWFFYTPNLLPPFIILILGFLHDVIYLLPLGSTSLIFLLSILLIQAYKEFFLEPSFFEIWISFVVIFSISIFCSWALISLIRFAYLPIEPILFKIFINLLIFPFTYIFLYYFFNKLRLEKISRNKNV
tara:strand:- start:146 stop:673 length:528 start_codon:yes stop_codon:yes gene_type:complete